MSFTSRIKIEDLINNGSILVHKDGNHGAKYPRTEEFGELGVPFLTAKLLDNSGNIDLLKAPRLAKEKAQKFTFGFVQPEDVLLSHNATVGRVAVMPQVDEPILIGTSLTHFRLDKSKILPTYLAAYFSGKDFQDQLAAVMSQTTRNQVPITSQRKLYIELPSIEIQAEIVKYIDSIDNKIRLNNKINQTLESIAQAIFKSWFIDFDPVRAKIVAKQEGKDPELAAMCAISGKSEAEIEQMAKDDFAELQATAALFPDEFVDSELGEVPRGWVVSTVGEQVQTVGGGTPSTKNADFWDNGIHHWTTPKDLSNLTDKILLTTERKITDIGLKKISSGILPKDTVLMSSRAPVGYLALAKIEVAINQGYIAILPNTKYSAEYLIQWCEANMAEIKGRASGTTFQEISKKNFREISFVCPDEKVIAVYTRTAKTLYDEITLKAKEKQSLINLRDTLLPKLLLGEVEIPDFINEGE